MPTCKNCTTGFTIAPEDRLFYDKIAPGFGGKRYALPDPTLCPDCRMQRRMSWGNETHLYRRKCDKTDKTIVSIYSPDKPYKVYDREVWWSDQWDPLEYGQDYDFNRPFFDQFYELSLKVPKQALHQNNNENCDFTTSTSRNKNGYLISNAQLNEDCFYGNKLIKNKNCIDNTALTESELCYECVDCENCVNVSYSQNSRECSNSRFLYDCRDCKDCLFCYGMRHRQYCIQNKQYSKEEYEAMLAKMDFSSHEFVAKLKTKFSAFCLKFPHKFYVGIQNEAITNCDYIHHSKGCSDCFDVHHLEDCKYCTWMNKAKDCQDVYAFGLSSEMLYECMQVGDDASRVLWSASCWGNVSELLYCLACHSSQNLFGCIGLKNKKYAILNRVYSKADYEALVPKIIQHMRTTGEWGEFFPTQYAHFNYNESVAGDQYPLNKEEVLRRGWKWKESDDEEKNIDNTVEAQNLPDKIGDVTADILKTAILDPKEKQPFRIIPHELKFYRDQKIPLPRLHPEERQKARQALRNPRHIFDRTCMKCAQPIKTSYAPDRPEKVYCKECYLKEMY